MPGPTALPAMDVPAPRVVSGTPACRDTPAAATTSPMSRGNTTTWGTTR